MRVNITGNLFTDQAGEISLDLLPRDTHTVQRQRAVNIIQSSVDITGHTQWAGSAGAAQKCRGNSHSSQRLRAGWLRKVQAVQLHWTPSSSSDTRLVLRLASETHTHTHTRTPLHYCVHDEDSFTRRLMK